MEETVDIFKRKYKYAADYALFLGGYIAFFFILDFLFPDNTFVGLLSFFALLATPLVCFRLATQYRDKAWGGYIHFGQVWAFGVWLFLFTSLLMSVLYYIQCQFLQPDYLTTFYNDTLKMMETIKYPKESIDAWVQFGIMTPIQYVFYIIWMYLVGGAILFLIISPFVTRKKPNDSLNLSDLEKPSESYQDKNDSNESQL